MASKPLLCISRRASRLVSRPLSAVYATGKHASRAPNSLTESSTFAQGWSLVTVTPRRPSLVKRREPASIPNSSLQPRSTLQYSKSAAGTGSTEDRTQKFAFKIAAAYSDKKKEFKPKENNFGFNSTTGTQHLAGKPVNFKEVRGSKLPSGQDAFFISNVGKTDAVAFGVCDGVGGWMDHGLDPADFAHGLCNHMADTASTFPSNGSTTSRLQPKDMLQIGYTKTCEDKSIEGGGSTACVAVAEANGVLTIANLGDSGFVQLRLNAVNYVSRAQTHGFNTPFQLSLIPQKMLQQIEMYGGNHPLRDMPKDASVTKHEIRHGDVLVFATDGVWDNLNSQEILEIVSNHMLDSKVWSEDNGGINVKMQPDANGEDGTALQTTLAAAIVQKAKQASLDRRRDGPFAKAYTQAYRNNPRAPRYSGGKPDDICVVVVIAYDQNDGSM